VDCELRSAPQLHRSGAKCNKAENVLRAGSRCGICGEQVNFIEQSLSISSAFLVAKTEGQ
jgi:hypothetical protein